MIADPSALAAFFLNEESRPEIESLMSNESTVHTLDIAPVEVLNAVWKRFIHKQLTHEQAELVRREIENSIAEDLLQVNLSRNFIAKSLNISFRHKLAIYDSLFIALCLRNRERLLSLDEKQKDAARLEGIRVIDLS